MLVSLKETASGQVRSAVGSGHNWVCRVGGRKEKTCGLLSCDPEQLGQREAEALDSTDGVFWSCVLISINTTKPSIHPEYSGQGAILVTAHYAGVAWNSPVADGITLKGSPTADPGCGVNAVPVLWSSSSLWLPSLLCGGIPFCCVHPDCWVRTHPWDLCVSCVVVVVPLRRECHGSPSGATAPPVCQQMTWSNYFLLKEMSLVVGCSDP